MESAFLHSLVDYVKDSLVSNEQPNALNGVNELAIWVDQHVQACRREGHKWVLPHWGKVWADDRRCLPLSSGQQDLQPDGSNFPLPRGATTMATCKSLHVLWGNWTIRLCQPSKNQGWSGEYRWVRQRFVPRHIGHSCRPVCIINQKEAHKTLQFHILDRPAFPVALELPSWGPKS